MPSSGRAPVNEVVLAVSFEQHPALTGLRLVSAARQFEAELDKVEEQPPYAMPEELPLAAQSFKQPGLELRLAGPGTPVDRRLWLTSSVDSSILVQLQANYFAVNWRAVEPDVQYPGFDRLLEIFNGYLSRLAASLGEEGIPVNRAEVTYVNIMRPGELWRKHSDLGNIIAVSSPAMHNFESASLDLARPLRGGDGAFVGRVHSSVQTGFQLDSAEVKAGNIKLGDSTPVVNFSITARSASLRSGSPQQLSSFFELAHDEATALFRELTTEQAREAWGLS